jgi:hypothetical protein
MVGVSAGRDLGAGAGADAAAAARAQAARDVCAASAAFASCTHRRRRSSPRGPHFVDWYLVLAVSTTTLSPSSDPFVIAPAHPF